MKPAIALLLITLALLLSANSGISNKEKSECNSWQARHYPKHFAEWQIEQCANYKITLNNK